MPSYKQLLLPGAICALSASFSPAAETPPPATPAPPALSEPAATAPAPERPRVVSRDLSEKIGAALPKYSPAPPPETPILAENATPEIAAFDTPQNEIFRLPRVDVGEIKPPEFRERELLTHEGRVALALERHPGLKFGPFARLNIRRGLQILADEHQAERNTELAELAQFIEFVRTVPRPATTAAE